MGMKDNMEEIMEELEQPSFDVGRHQQEFRLTLLNTRRSATIGAILLILPLLFFSGVTFKHYLGMDFGILTSVYSWVGELDQKYGDSSVINWIIRSLLLLGPPVAIGINLLAILHVHYEKPRREIVMSLKVKWLNLGIIIICTFIFLTFFFYLILENAGGKIH